MSRFCGSCGAVGHFAGDNKHPCVPPLASSRPEPLDVEGVIAELLGAESAVQDGIDRLHRATDTLAAIAREYDRLGDEA